MSDLRNVPGIGPKKEKELMELGYPSLESLKDADPEDLYIKACLHRINSYALRKVRVVDLIQ